MKPLTTLAPAIALLACSQLALEGCGQRAHAQGSASAPPPAVSVAPAVQRDLNDREEFSGRLEAIEFVSLRPRIAGTIEKVLFTDGALVHKGDLLFTVDPRPFEAEVARAQAQVAAAEARSQLALLELRRANTLLISQASSIQEVEELTSGSRTAVADHQAAAAALRLARLNLEWTEIRAPISGRISSAAVRSGNLVDEQTVLTSIAGVSQIYAYFDGSEQSFLRLRGQTAGATPARVQMRLADETGFPHEGHLDFVDNRLNPQTGSIRLRAGFDNAKGQFIPGLAVRVRLESPAVYRAVLVPERAIGTDQSKKFVYVVGVDGKAQHREVTPGPLFDTMRVVVSGVKPGEQIVVDGLQRVVPGSAVSAQFLKIDAEGVPLPAPAPGPAASSSSGQA